MSSTIEQATLTVPDISCGHCEAMVTAAVGDLDGVASVEASATTKRVVVAYDPDRVSLDRIAAALDKAGYPAQA